jgi:hypothetical protein
MIPVRTISQKCTKRGCGYPLGHRSERILIVAMVLLPFAKEASAAEVPRPKPVVAQPAVVVPVPQLAPRPEEPHAAVRPAAVVLPAMVPRRKPVTRRSAPAKTVFARPGPDPESLRRKYAACERALRDLGARFERRSGIRQGRCGARRPLLIASVGDVALSTTTTMRCPAAVALARWVREVVEPAASRHFRTGVTGLDVAAGYACRTRRNGSGSSRLSEHALANAIDISGVQLTAGRSVPVRPRRGAAPETRFQKDIRQGACRLFTTVLGPGSDGFHEKHFHFDLAERRSGYRLCR